MEGRGEIEGVGAGAGEQQGRQGTEHSVIDTDFDEGKSVAGVRGRGDLSLYDRGWARAEGRVKIMKRGLEMRMWLATRRRVRVRARARC